MVDTGVAVRAKTFGQCIDAIRAMKVEWKDGPVAGQSDAGHRRQAEGGRACRSCRCPTTRWPRPSPAEFIFYFRSNSALDTNAAVADVRKDRAEVWSALKTPIAAQAAIAAGAAACRRTR